jgi:serine protease SohB
MVGSIGVVTEIPNFSRLLEKNHVDVYEMTAGKSKRTVTPLGKVTPEGVEKLQQQLHSIHTAFKMHITAHRPQLAATIDDVATGEAWLAVEAKGLGLVDEIMTSDEYIAQRSACVDVIAINPKREKSGLAALIAGEVRSAASAALGQVFGELGRSAAAAAVPRVLNVAPPFDAV